MVVLIVLSQAEFRDESLNTVKLFLDKWRISYKLASFGPGPCVGSHGKRFSHDLNVMQAKAIDYDVLMLIDGDGVEAQRLYEYRPMLDLVVRFNEARKLVCAIGNTMKIVARANIVKGKRVAEAPDDETRRLMLLFDAVPAAAAFEISGNLMTVRDAGHLEPAMQEFLKHTGAY